MRCIIIETIAEFRGGLINDAADNSVLSYDLDSVLHALFSGTAAYKDMVREFKTFLIISAEKSSHKRDSKLFHHYVRSLVESPKTWFRMRDCDALARFTIAAALACNDLDDIWYNEEQLQILTELSVTLYDAVAFYKHRAEGETNNTFAYAGEETRKESFRRCREIIWALDVAWAHDHAGRCVINFIRPFGGPIHMMMRRYRYVEEELTIGRPETESVVAQTRQNVKLWSRNDAADNLTLEDRGQKKYEELIARGDELMFTGLARILERASQERCEVCEYGTAYGARIIGEFSGVRLCKSCLSEWTRYLQDVPSRAVRVFPVLMQYLPEFENTE
ncbi:aba 3 [Fusarium globosum]|uniref:Aba 3 n=1 Tax=Fusarium globosum TaxID=78864 RepID=A0A8H5YKE8_9HYPO|nr:aba 3 [Fusarium globosum]